MAMEDREFENLIGSDKVEGTAVYGADQAKIGAIKRSYDRQDQWHGIL